MGSSKQTIGYDYFFGIHMGVSRGPVNEIIEIQVADRTAWTGSITDNTTVQIDAAELFGGESGEGGVEGPLEVMMGAPDQPVNSKLEAMLGILTPAFRGMCTLFFDGLVSSINPYPKPWSFRVRRSTAGWDGAAWNPLDAVVLLKNGAIHAMNPAHIIYEALTNRDWGRGLERTLIGNTFAEAATTLKTEGNGLCLRWNRQTSLNEFIQEVVDHIGANAFLDPRTGKWELQLVRDDYVIEDLPLFDVDSGLLAIDDDDSAATAPSVNEVIVTYRDPITNEDGQVRVQNLAAIQSAGAIRSQTLSFTGLPTAELANRVAQRELRTRSTGVKRFKLRLDRRAFLLLPGSVFRISAPERGIENTVLRVANIKNQEQRQGPIELEAVQDVFGLPANSFVTPQPPGWIPPQITPVPITEFAITELTYRDSINVQGLRDLSQGDTGAWVAAVARRANPLGRNFRIQSQPDGGTVWTEGELGDYTPTAALVDAMPPTEAPVAVILTDASDLDFVELGTAALIDDEILRVDALDPEAFTATLARGCVDTTPAAHESGARVWFFDDSFAGVETAEYEQGETVSARLLSRTSTAQLNPVEATSGTIVLQGRPGRPYPPGRVRINGLAFPEAARGVLSISWEPRDKTLIQDQLVDASMLGVGSPDVQYRLRLVRTDTGAILDEKTAEGDQTTATLFSGFSGSVRLEVVAQREGFNPDSWSHQAYEMEFVYVSAGYGRAYGFAWGGTLRPGVIAPRGGIAASPQTIQLMGDVDGIFYGLWLVAEDLSFSALVSSADGVNWVNLGQVPGGAPIQKVNGTWYIGGGKFFASDPAGPYSVTSDDVLGNSSVRFTGGARFMGGRWVLKLGRFGVPGPGNYATDADVLDQFRQMPVPEPISGAFVVPEGSPIHGANGFVQIFNDTDNNFDPIVSSNSQARLYHSLDLENWTLVTPQLLADGNFGSGGLTGKWSGSVAYVGGRYLLMATLGSNEGTERVIFSSSNGVTWTQATQVGELGIGQLLGPVFHDGNYIYSGGSRNWRNLGPPKHIISTDSINWQTTEQDPFTTPGNMFGRLSTPSGIITLAGSSSGGPIEFREGHKLHISTDNGLTWQPINMQRPDSL